MSGPVNLEGALAYRAGSGRDWLEVGEAQQLTALLDCFWEHEGQIGERITNAIWQQDLALAPPATHARKVTGSRPPGCADTPSSLRDAPLASSRHSDSVDQ